MAKSTLSSEALEAIQKFYGSTPNKTFDKPPGAAELKGMKMVRYMAYTIDSFRSSGKRRNIHVIGPAGIGKTRTGYAIAAATGLKVVYLNAANVDQENLGLPTLVKRGDREAIQWRLLRQLLEPGEKVVLLDEKRQADPGSLSVFMELESEGSIGGVPVPGLVSTWVFDNPSGDDYGELATEDAAQADRTGTIFITSADTAWEYGLAMSHPELNLKKAFDVYNRLPLSTKGREVFSARVLDHVIQAVKYGFNAELGWPIRNDQYIPLESLSGNDVRSESLEKIVAALGLTNPPRTANDFDRAIDAAAAHGLDVIAYGTQGTGKTSRVKARLAEIGVGVAYKSVPVITKEDINLTVPSADGESVDIITHDEFMSDDPTIGVFDEVTRGSRRTTNAILEIINEHTSGGQPLPNYLASIMLTNLSRSGGHTMDVDEVTLPFATRPDLNFIVSVEDVHSMEWLVATHGNDIVPFTDWWRMDLDGNPEYRELISPRCLERMFEHHSSGLDIQWALPVLNDEYVPVPLVKLRARLSGSPMVSFLNLVEETEDYEKRLQDISDSDNDSSEKELRLEVYMALLNAELPLLQANRDVCIRMMRVIGEQWRYKLLKTQGDKWFFWSDILTEAFPDV